MSHVVLYVAARFAVFGALFAVLWLVGVDPYLAAGLAIVVSIPLAYVVLRPLRDRATAALQERARRKAEFRARLRGE